MITGGAFVAFAPPLLGVGASSGTYSVAASCAVVVAGVPLPTFADVPPDETGTCSNVSGSGTFNSLGCGTGTTTGHLSLTEPAGDSVTLSYTMVFVAGAGVVTGTWSDDGGSGLAAGVVVLVPQPPASCTGIITQYNFTAVVAAEY